MRKRLTPIVAASSLLLGVLLLAAWARSYFVADDILFSRGHETLGVYSHGGQVVVVRLRARRDFGRGATWGRDAATAGTPYSGGRLEALALFKRVATPGGWYCVFPHWPAALAAAAPAGGWWAARARWRGRATSPGAAAPPS